LPKVHTDDCLGGIIKSARISKGLTQYQLAALLGISARYLKLIENSGRKPSYNLLMRIFCELGIPSDRIFYLSGEKHKI